MIGLLSTGIARIPHLESLLGEPFLLLRPWTPRRQVDAIAGWGLRTPAERALRYAQRQGLPFIRIEDGFLRSVSPGPDEPPRSLVRDDLGIYYDASRPSRLEAMIGETLDPAAIERARRIIGLWREQGVSKYNHAPRAVPADLPERFVLVADQVAGDASIHYGGAEPGAFMRMLDSALAENPDTEIVVKLHPDVTSGRRAGHFDPVALRKNPRVHVVATELHPAALLARADAVYAVTSQIGFEGLIWGARVRTFGMPFYAGWGLTQDELPPPDRRGRAPLESLIHAALVRYPRYVDPASGDSAIVESVIAGLGACAAGRAQT